MIITIANLSRITIRRVPVHRPIPALHRFTTQIISCCVSYCITCHFKTFPSHTDYMLLCNILYRVPTHFLASAILGYFLASAIFKTFPSQCHAVWYRSFQSHTKLFLFPPSSSKTLRGIEHLHCIQSFLWEFLKQTVFCQSSASFLSESVSSLKQKYKFEYQWSTPSVSPGRRLSRSVKSYPWGSRHLGGGGTGNDWPRHGERPWLVMIFC